MLNGRPESVEEAAGFLPQTLTNKVYVTFSVKILMEEKDEGDANNNFSRNVAFDMCKIYGNANVSWETTDCEDRSEFVVSQRPED